MNVSIDMKNLNEDRYYVFCVNFPGMILANYLKSVGKYVEYLDNDKEKWNKIVVEQKCISPNSADISTPCVIAAQNSDSRNAIRNQLKSLGFCKIFDIDDNWKKEWVDSYAPQMDDELYLKVFWYSRMGNNLDLDHPKTFNEKLQWLKLHDQRLEYTIMADKYEVKKWVAEVIGNKYVIPTYGVYDSFSEIDFDSVPDSFVIKTTHDSGGTDICRNKREFNYAEVKNHMEYCMSYNYYYKEREFSYKGIKPRIIIEKYLEDEGKSDISDYKVFCFDGIPQLIQVDIDRYTNHRRNLYSTDWELLDFSLQYPTAHEIEIKKPECLEELLNASRALSKGIPHVRVDFYIIGKAIFFGEMTFYHGGGYEVFDPREWDDKMGSFITVI